MNVTFRISYKTNLGEFIYVTGNQRALGDFDQNQAIPLHYVNEQTWEVDIPINTGKVEYQYFIKTAEGEIIQEWDTRTLIIPRNRQHILLRDEWLAPNLPEFNLNTKVFRHIAPDFKSTKLRILKKHTHLFTIRFRILNPDERLYILGEPAQIGGWEVDKALEMKWDGEDHYFLSVDISNYSNTIAYKYIVKNIKTNALVYYELGENRITPPAIENEWVVCHDVGLQQPHEKLWRGSAVAIPVFSLRSKQGLGVGEFLDLIAFGIWCKASGFSMIQILPINDTMAFNTWGDSYPYSAISVYALHPMYLSLYDLPYPLTSRESQEIAQKAEKLNQEKFLQYNEVVEFKLNFLNNYFNKFEGDIIQNPQFKTFFENNIEWLKSYAAFSVLRDENKTSEFTSWDHHQQFSPSKINAFFIPENEYYSKVMFYAFVQWQLHEQLSKAVGKLHQMGLTLKGDLPIGIYRYSADAWSHPELFHLDKQAGAPPDDFAVQGQNWQFPTYHWAKMKEDDYDWWKKRFKFMARYFDAYRIDHILGFFRIWQIPMDAVYGVLGRFEPAIPITIDELHDREIYLDEKRLYEPYIPYDLIKFHFGDETNEIIRQYFEYQDNLGTYAFKDAYATQKKILKLLGEKHPHTHSLLDMATQVLFIKEDSKEVKLHPRHGLQKTSSYAYLPEETQHKLNLLYEDYFFHRQEQLWKKEGLEKLPVLIHTTNMLTCGEDLGMVPQVVPEVMQDLAILSLYVQRMPKEAFTKFSHPAQAPYLAVVSPSSHDTSTLRQWWKEDQENTQYFYNHLMGKEGVAPKELSAELLEIIVDQHIYSPAMLSVIPLQEFLSLDDSLKNPDEAMERINIPSVFPHPWQYRMHVYIEELIDKKEFADYLKTKHTLANRN